MGLGTSPDSVHISGNVHADASAPNNNATTTFWRGVEGLSVTPAGGAMQWAVSQAVPFRRMHIRGDIVLHQNGGSASRGRSCAPRFLRTRRVRPCPTWIMSQK